MKQKRYTIAIVAAVAIIVGALLFRAGSSDKNSAVADCVKSGGTYNLDTGSCLPAGASNSVTPGSQTVSGTNVVTSKPGTVTKPAAIAYYTPKVQPTMLPTYPTVISSTTQIQVTNPTSNTAIASPFKITGLARGSWYFEGSFPVILVDSKNKILAQGPAISQSNWMTTELVPFTATLAFPRQTTGSKGFLILKKDNPSGLPQNDAAVQMQVTFQ